MNTLREKVLTVLLGGFIVVAVLGFLYYLFIYSPLVEMQSSIETARGELTKKKTEWANEQKKNKTIIENSPRLGQWAVLSLPEPATREPQKLSAFQEGLHLDYEKFLDTTFRKHGFTGSSFRVDPKDPPKPVVANPTPAATSGSNAPPVRTAQPKGPPYSVLNYTAVAIGPHANLLQALRDFHQAPVLHEIKSMMLERIEQPKAGQSKTDLRLEMNIEVLRVQGAEKLDGKTRTETIVSADRLKGLNLLPAQYADYESLLKNDMFLGKPPPPRKGPERIAEAPVRVEPPKEEPKVEVTPPPTTPREDARTVLGFVKLSMIVHNGRRWEAYYYDQGTGTERMLTLGARNAFELKDKYENVLVSGEVLNISTTEGIYFKAADGKLYRWASREFLYDSLQRPIELIGTGRKAMLVKGLEDVPGLAVMSLGDVLEPYGPRPAVVYGFGTGLAGMVTPKTAPARPAEATTAGGRGNLRGGMSPREPQPVTVGDQ